MVRNKIRSDSGNVWELNLFESIVFPSSRCSTASWTRSISWKPQLQLSNRSCPRPSESELSAKVAFVLCAMLYRGHIQIDHDHHDATVIYQNCLLKRHQVGTINSNCICMQQQSTAQAYLGLHDDQHILNKQDIHEQFHKTHCSIVWFWLFAAKKIAKIKNSFLTKYQHSFKRLNNTDKADICGHVSHSRRHSLQRMKLHHSRMLQDLFRKQEALSLEHRSLNTRGRLMTISSANKSLAPFVPLMNPGRKNNLQLPAHWIFTVECFGLHWTELLFAFLFMNVCQGEMSPKISPPLRA